MVPPPAAELLRSIIGARERVVNVGENREPGAHWANYEPCLMHSSGTNKVRGSRFAVLVRV